jgi:transposase
VIIVGIDPHKQTHTAVAIDAQTGEALGERTVAARRHGHERLLRWAQAFGQDVVFAVEDCRHVSRGLERLLLERGVRVARVPPRLMGQARGRSRTRGKSDAIDALAVARAALANPGLPVASLAGPEREMQLLVIHRDDLVAERTRVTQRLRWHLHDLLPALDPPSQVFSRRRWRARVADALAALSLSAQVRIAADQLARVDALCGQIDELAHVESRDMLVMSAASAMATLAGLLLRIASWTGYSERWVVRTRLPGQWGLFGDALPGLAAGSVLSLGMVFVRLLLAVPLAVLLVVYALTLPAIAALSRAREFAADRSAAILTGTPATLAAALLKLSGEIERLPERDLRAAGLMNALLVVPTASSGRVFGRLTATHPPVLLRVERLLAMHTTIEGHPRAVI